MPRRAYRYCKGCGRSRDEVGFLSWSKLCAECGDARLLENVYGLMHKRGPALERWRRGMAASVGGVLLDDAPEQD